MPDDTSGLFQPQPQPLPGHTVGRQDHAVCRFSVDTGVEAFGRLVIPVNNAAIQSTHDRLGDLSWDARRRTWASNVDEASYVTVARHAVTGGLPVL